MAIIWISITISKLWRGLFWNSLSGSFIFYSKKKLLYSFLFIKYSFSNPRRLIYVVSIAFTIPWSISCFLNFPPKKSSKFFFYLFSCRLLSTPDWMKLSAKSMRGWWNQSRVFTCRSVFSVGSTKNDVTLFSISEVAH